MYLNGFAFSGYRSVSDNLIKLAPLSKINLIIGQNNSGKSNVIRFLHQHYSDCISATSNNQIPAERAFQPIDYHSLYKSAIRVSYPLTTDAALNEHVSAIAPDKRHQQIRDLIIRILQSEQFSDSNGIAWFTYVAKGPRGPFELDLDYDAIKGLLTPNNWQTTWNACTGQNGGSLDNHWIPETIQRIAYKPTSVPHIELIPAIRKVGEGDTPPTDYSGHGLIQRLAQIQNPSVSQQDLKEDFQKINTFLQEVLERSDAAIEIPYERDMILVHMDNKTLPLSSLGTGIHEVIILAAASTILKQSILCVEEPELHLHPRLQRALVRYLYEHTDNQYIFTTHSAHLLDSAPASIFHVTTDHHCSILKETDSTKSKSEICINLGYRASDILQSNCVIWVEGPSDRIYLNYWLTNKNENLIEGVHYTIMFYGGRLSSHLSGHDPDQMEDIVDDFISLRTLNRNAVFIIDSDKDKPNAQINATKKRLKTEFNDGPGFCWVTKGREIENYLNEEELERCVAEVHRDSYGIVEKGRWANLMRFKPRTGGKVCSANKVKVAHRYVTSVTPNLNVLDLRDRIQELDNFIRECNRP